MTEFIFHIADKKDWLEAKSKGEYEHPSLKEEGFIHCSKVDQVVPVANLFFKKQQNELVLLKIDPDLLTSKLQYDAVEEMGEDFPHIYGPLNPEAVVASFDFYPHKNGEYELPEFIDF